MLCVGNSITLLVVGRLLQGVSAAVVATVGLAMMVDTVGQKDIGQAVGWVSLSMSIALLVAPVLGGVVYAMAGYYAVYYTAFALIAVDVALRLMMIEKKHAKGWDMEEESERETNEVESLREASSTHAAAIAVGLNREDSPPAIEAFSQRFNIPPVFSLLVSGRLLSAAWCILAQSTILTAWDAVLPLRVADLFGW